MVRIILVLLFLLTGPLDSQAWMGFQTFAGSGDVSAEAADCLDATYTFSYDGDHSSGATYACYASGASSLNASTNTADSVTVSYVEYDADNEYIEWTGEYLSGVHTIYFSVHVIDRDSDSTVGTCNLLESYYDGTNYIKVVLIAEYIRIYYGDGSATDCPSSGKLAFDTNYRVGVTWDQGNDKYAVSLVALGNSPVWNEQTGEGLSAWSGPPASIILGEDAAGNGVNERVRIFDAIALAGYETADPM